MAFFKSKFGKTYYEIHGKKKVGIPLVCLHGGPGGTAYYFGPLKALAKSRMVVLYDQIGSGRSSHLNIKDQKIETFVDDLKNLLKELGISKFHLLGSSWGGSLAIEYCLRTKSQGVESLILQSPLVSAKIWERDAKVLLKTLSKEHQKVIKYCLEIDATDSYVYQNAEKAYYKKYVYRGKPDPKRAAFYKKFPNSHGQLLYQMMWGPSEFKATGRLKNYERAKDLKKIKVPTLFICGEFDEAKANTLKGFAKKIRGSRVEVIKGASHSILGEKPKGMIKVVENFLKGR